MIATAQQRRAEQNPAYRLARHKSFYFYGVHFEATNFASSFCRPPSVCASCFLFQSGQKIPQRFASCMVFQEGRQQMLTLLRMTAALPRRFIWRSAIVPWCHLANFNRCNDSR
jgi:hypothetical protein